VTLPWDPALYRRHDDHRARPFLDLVGRIGASDPREVVDLGCGPGHLTEVLAQRWPGARVRASDSSPEMVAAAREAGVDAELADVREYAPGPETDVVVSNAVLHWVPEHRELLARWAGTLPSGGWLAVQVPGNETSPSHTIARDLLGSDAWTGRVPDGLAAYGVGTPGEYARLLAGARPDGHVDCWETTYVHPLIGSDTGGDPVGDWLAGTTLRPVRAALTDADWERLRADLAPRLRAAYPPDDAGTTWFGFRRVFAVLGAG
jgi:trans-aconitate 2-methyltransferase